MDKLHLVFFVIRQRAGLPGPLERRLRPDLALLDFILAQLQLGFASG